MSGLQELENKSQIKDICECCGHVVYSDDAERPDLEVGFLRLRYSDKAVWWRERSVRLTPREFDLLEVIARRYPRRTERHTIETLLFDHCNAGDNAVSVLLNRIRHKFEDMGANLVTTHMGRGGYQLNPSGIAPMA